MQVCNASQLRETVRSKINELTRQSHGGREPPVIGDDDPLVGTGLLDSAATIELVLWIEETFEGQDQIELTAVKYGTVNKIVENIIRAAPVSAVRPAPAQAS
jgi:acyl carrier protein